MDEQIFSGAATANYATAPMPAPAPAEADVDIVARPDHYEVITDLKGASEDDVVVGILDHVLTVGSKTATETCSDIGSFLVVDHRERRIEQSFALPNDADEDDMYLNFSGGKLKVVIARRAAGETAALATPAYAS